MRQVTVKEADEGQRLDKYLFKYMNTAPKSFIYKMLRKKNIVLNGHRCDGSEKIGRGDEIKLFMSEETIESFMEERRLPEIRTSGSMKLNIVFEDRDILIVDKPAGILSQKARAEDISMNEYILDYLAATGAWNTDKASAFVPSVCNRLDRNTSGLIAAGKTLKGSRYLSQVLRDRSAEKYYLCIAVGSLSERMKTDAWLQKDEKNNRVTLYAMKHGSAEHIITEYIPVDSSGKYTLLKVKLHTGKTHQIRAHLSYLGYPLAGDYKYGNHEDCEYFRRQYGIRSQILHSYELRLPDYGIHVYADIPDYMKKVLDGEQLWVHGKQEDLEALH